MVDGDSLSNAFVGAIVTVVLTPFLPFAPVAGYLHGGTGGDGIRVGAISGAIAVVPALVFAFVVFSVIGAVVGGLGGLGWFVGGLGAFLLVPFFLFGVLYVVGLSLAGGWIGSFLMDRAAM